MNAAELKGPALDWAVALAAERLGRYIYDPARLGTSIVDIDFNDRKDLMVYAPLSRDIYIPWQPSRDWAQAGPIIDEYRIETAWVPAVKEWRAQAFTDCEGTAAYGPTCLIAAMRCFVASKLGHRITIPKSLL